MRRITAGCIGTLIGTGLLVGYKAAAGAWHSADSVATGTAPTAPGRAWQPPPPEPGRARAPASAPATAPVADSGRLVDGRYLGRVVLTRYGPVQVRVVISGRRITDVVAVQLPAAAARGIEIGRRVTPVLRARALRRQSADLDTVSGATYTSAGYRDSLQSALDAAGPAAEPATISSARSRA